MDAPSDPAADPRPSAPSRGDAWQDPVSKGLAVAALIFAVPLPLLGLALGAAVLASARSRTWAVPAGIGAIALSAACLVYLHITAFGLGPMSVWP